MKDSETHVQLRRASEAHVQLRRASGHSNEPALQVICLGSGGGPSEDNVTGFLVRSTATKWGKNSVLAVDAGSHLAAITRILEKDFPLVSEPVYKDLPRPRSNGNGNAASLRDDIDTPSPGTAHDVSSVSLDEDFSSSGLDSPSSEAAPETVLTTLKHGAFAGLPFPNASARANALHVVREHVSTYLITHPHLDHVSGFVINTAAFHNTSRPKRLAALPFTVNAIKTHIFNNIVWPNLTDEDGGVGLVTFQRLAEGGNIALGEGSGRGYIEVCDGLSVRGFKVSHGHCMTGPAHIHRGSAPKIPETPSMGIHRASTHHALDHNMNLPIAEGREQRSLSFSHPTQSMPGTPLFAATNPDASRASGGAGGGGTSTATADQCVIDSTAYFIRAESTSYTPTKEILIFGDVEPDSISLSPRTARVWAEAAPKIAAGTLAGIFIECSYTNVQGDAVLYGHLSPRHLLAELANLAEMVREARIGHEREREEARKGRKRKRASNGLLFGSIATADGSTGTTTESARKSSRSRTYGVVDDEIMTDLVATAAPSPTPNPPSSHNTTTTTNTRLSSSTGTHTPVHSGAAAAAASASSTTTYPPSHHHHPSSATAAANAAAALNLSNVSSEHSKAVLAAAFDSAPLKGLKVVIIHVKDSLSDGPLVGEGILSELREGERDMGDRGKGLGCLFEVAVSGGSYWF
ncbi:hypothetical protein DM02DRAFT_605887 [Periconia macrospinosa]|uniref:Cyclic-AMP phosphodiesterase n=1 Tax=Periconia macrospinosa TaxID=97972 RepID=A0A2V1D1X3_9PLEO|nr:hypothetical protein DM02DRAFT_605887 [Periconia macrospinosa]